MKKIRNGFSKWAIYTGYYLIFVNLKINKFSKILSKDDNNSYEVEKIKSLLNYAFTEANEHTLKRISVKKYMPPSLSFVLPLILFSLFLGLGYLVHKRRNFK